VFYLCQKVTTTAGSAITKRIPSIYPRDRCIPHWNWGCLLPEKISFREATSGFCQQKVATSRVSIFHHRKRVFGHRVGVFPSFMSICTVTALSLFWTPTTSRYNTSDRRSFGMAVLCVGRWPYSRSVLFCVLSKGATMS